MSSTGGLAAGDGHHELVRVVVGCVERDVVQPVEHHGGQPPEALVAVDQGMVAHDRLEQDGRLGVQVGVGLLAVELDLRPVCCGVEQARGPAPAPRRDRWPG